VTTELQERQRELARVERLRAADVVEGTVCRWKSGKYTYVALYIADMWWVTGVADFYGERKFTTYDFVTRVLSRGTEVAVVTAWEEIR
jgi:hypothetical protein